jgi:hypothetical protein
LWCSSMNLSFTTVKFRDFSWISFCTDRIESYQKVIRFNLGQNIWFDNKIRFDFDSIWQPWSQHPRNNSTANDLAVSQALHLHCIFAVTFCIGFWLLTSYG